MKTNTPVMKRQIISEETSKEVREALEHVVAQGTGKGAFVDGYRVGGKTGTAQKAKDGRYLENNHIVSFIGLAPQMTLKLLFMWRLIILKIHFSLEAS